MSIARPGLLLENLPLDLLKLLLSSIDKPSLFNLLLVSKIFRYFSLHVLNEGAYSNTKSLLNDQYKPAAAASKKTLFPNSFFSLRAAAPQTLIATHYTHARLLENGLLLRTDNHGAIKLLDKENKVIAEQQATKSIAFLALKNPAIIAVSQLDSNHFATLSDEGMMQVWQLGGKNQLSLVREKSLGISNLKQEWVANDDNGRMAIVTINPDAGYQVHYISIQPDNIEIEWVKSSIKGNDQNFKIRKIFLGTDCLFIQLTDVKHPKSCPYFALFSREQFSGITALFFYRDHSLYGESIASSFAITPQPDATLPFLTGFDCVKRTPTCDIPNYTLYNYSTREQPRTSFEAHTVQTWQVDKTRISHPPFLFVLSNQYLFLKAEENFTIFKVEMELHANCISTLKTRYTIQVPEAEHAQVRAVTTTQNGDLIITCDDKIYQWNLSGNELVVINQKTDDLKLADQSPIFAPIKKS